jgi:hypothetical protein
LPTGPVAIEGKKIPSSSAVADILLVLISPSLIEPSFFFPSTIPAFQPELELFHREAPGISMSTPAVNVSALFSISLPALPVLFDRYTDTKEKCTIKERQT